MKYLLILLLFITLPIVNAAVITDYIDDNGDLSEVMELQKVKSIGLPEQASSVTVQGSEYSINGSTMLLSSCDACTLSFVLKNVVIDEGAYLSFSRNLRGNHTYKVRLPPGVILDMESVAPNADEITTDGEGIVVRWQVNHQDNQRYYVRYTNHEGTESFWGEINNEFTEWSVWLFVILVFMAGFLLGYFLKKDTKISVVPEQLLSADEKKLLNALSEEMTQKELGKKLSWSKSKVSGVVTLLDQKKLVGRERIGRNYKVKRLSNVIDQTHQQKK